MGKTREKVNLINKEKTIPKRFVRLIDNVINLGIMLLLLLLFLLGCYSMWDNHMVYEKASAEQYEIFKPSNDEKMPSFTDLQEMNPEVNAWLTLNDTGIDYPVVQGENNEKYINTDVFGEYSLSGSLFLDYLNANDFSDFNNIIYGHHMEKDKMFGDLDKFKDQKYFNEHKYGNLHYQGKDHGLQIFAFVEGDAYNSELYQVGIEKENRQKYIEMIKNIAIYFRDVNIKTTDHIVMLSTCSSETTNGRYIVFCKITNKLYPNTSEEIDDNGSIHKIFVDIDNGGVWKMITGLSIYWYLIIVWIIIVIIIICYLLSIRKKKKHKKKKYKIIKYSESQSYKNHYLD